MAAENRREIARRAAEVESLQSELDLLREAKDAAVREATTARTSSEAAAVEAAAALRTKLAAVEDIRAEGAAQLDAQIRLHEQELASREQEWGEERQILVRARDAAAAGREHVKTQERLVKAADKLRKQLAVAEREKEALLREAAERNADHQSRAAEAMDTSMQSSEQVAEMRLLVQVAEAEKSEAMATVSRLQRELEASQREAAAERMALQAVFEKEQQEANLARGEFEREQREADAA